MLFSAHRGFSAFGGDAKKIEMAARFLSSGHKSLEWKCSKCRGPEAADGDSLRKIRNCDKEESFNLAFDFQPSLRRCPWSQLDEHVFLYVKWFSDWRDYRILPFESDTLSNEPAYVYEVIDLMSQTMRTIEADKARQQQADLERQSKRAKNGRR